MKLLVTGGAGYVGSIVANRRVEAGHETVVLDNLSNGHERAVSAGARFVKGDVLDARRLRGVLSEEGFDGVLHFAALSAVAESVEQPGRYYNNNTFGTLALLFYVRRSFIDDKTCRSQSDLERGYGLSIFRGRTVFQIAQDRKLFLNIDVGITRGELPISGREIVPASSEGSTSPGANNVRPENIVWSFGSAWADSAWLGSMMGTTEGTVWNRPLLGDLFGDLYYVRAAHRRDKDFVLGGSEETRCKLIRAFILSVVEAKFPRATYNGYLVVNEPGGSLGAPLLARALPESRLILLVRHPGGVIASALRASGESDQRGLGNGHEESRDEAIAPFEDPDFIVANQAARYFDFVGNAKEAYEEHRGPKVLVRYEDLLTDTLGTMKRVYSELGMAVDEEKLTRAVEEHSREQVTGEGSNKLYHEATPRNWKENLTPEQVEVVERVTAPLLGDFYPG